MSELLPIAQEKWEEFIKETKNNDKSVRSLGLTALTAIEQLSSEPSSRITATKERLLRPYAHETLWQACAEIIDAPEMNQGESVTSFGTAIHSDRLGPVRLSRLQQANERQIINIGWEEQLINQPWQFDDHKKGMIMVEADIHNVTVDDSFRATQLVKRYVYWHHPDNPTQKKIYGNLQPRSNEPKPNKEVLLAPQSLALAHEITDAAHNE